MSQPARMWAVIDEFDRIVENTVRRTRTEAIKAWLKWWTMPRMQKWPHWRTRGFTARRVIVTVEASK